jgi:hypothetical protein
MKKLVTALALTAVIAGSVSAREFTPYSGTPAPEPESGSDVCLEYDGGADFLGAFGSYYSWSQNTVVHFAAPAGGPWTLNEAQYYFYGAGSRAADAYTNTTGLNDPPTVPTHSSISWTPSPFPVGFESVDISGYGIVLNEGDLFGVGSALLPGDAISLFYAVEDGNPGYSWSVYYGTWYNDTADFNWDDGIRACLSGSVVPVEETTWGGVKSLYR